MSGLLVFAWLFGWVSVTVFVAFLNGTDDEAGEPPTYFLPLFFGWLWPVFLAMGAVVGFLDWVGSLNKGVKP